MFDPPPGYKAPITSRSEKDRPIGLRDARKGGGQGPPTTSRLTRLLTNHRMRDESDPDHDEVQFVFQPEVNMTEQNPLRNNQETAEIQSHVWTID